MTEIENISSNIHRLENRVVRAAVNCFYYSTQVPDELEDETLQQKLSNAVNELIEALPAMPAVKRNG